MATQPVSVNLSVEQLLEAIKHLSPAELRAFRKQFTAWQEQNGKQPDDEALHQAAKACLPATAERRLKRLIARSERGALTQKELAEYQALAQEAERINVMRAQALAELVRRQGMPLQVVLAENCPEGGADGP